MFSHIMVGANDIDAAKTFYDATLGALGYGPGVVDPKGRVFYVTDSGIFAITVPIDGNPATHGNGSTIGFAAATTEAADAWHAAGLANGGTDCEEPPGVR
ncbi:MAG: VOC family protein, partial [Halieaceae bacterium]